MKTVYQCFETICVYTVDEETVNFKHFERGCGNYKLVPLISLDKSAIKEQLSKKYYCSNCRRPMKVIHDPLTPRWAWL